MSARIFLGATAALLLAAATPASAHTLMPRAFNGLRPCHLVEEIMAQREALSLSYEQFGKLHDLSLSIRNEPHRFTHRGGKPHLTQHMPMVTREQAYDEALAVLTPDQQARVEVLFPVPAPAVREPRKLTQPHGKP